MTPDSAAHPGLVSLSLSLSYSLMPIHPEGTPGSCWGWTLGPKSLTVWITINCGKILKELGIPDHLTCFLRNLYAGQEATAWTGHGTTDWYQIRKGAHQGDILSPCLFNFYVEYIMRNTGLDEAQPGIKIGEISITSDIQMTPPLWQKVKRN